MAKYGKEIVKRICSLIETDSYTIAEICKSVGIHVDTYYSWLKKSEFSEAIKKAQDRFVEDTLIECNKSLVKLIKGHTEKDKYYPPNLGAIIHFQTNRDPDNWKNRQENKVSGEIGIKSALENLSDEELQKIIDESK